MRVGAGRSSTLLSVECAATTPMNRDGGAYG